MAENSKTIKLRDRVRAAGSTVALVGTPVTNRVRKAAQAVDAVYDAKVAQAVEARKVREAKAEQRRIETAAQGFFETVIGTDADIQVLVGLPEDESEAVAS